MKPRLVLGMWFLCMVGCAHTPQPVEMKPLYLPTNTVPDSTDTLRIEVQRKSIVYPNPSVAPSRVPLCKICIPSGGT
jgi:hypothetical protein